MAAHFYAEWPVLLLGGVAYGLGDACVFTALGHYFNTVSLDV